MQVRVGADLGEPSEVELFLTARWGLHTSWYGRSMYLPNVHQEWPLHTAECIDLVDDPREGLLARAGFSTTGPPVSVLYSPGVAVRFGPPTLL
jgi:uncharacterized protein YqjF (DUF2071 family)